MDVCRCVWAFTWVRAHALIMCMLSYTRAHTPVRAHHQVVIVAAGYDTRAYRLGAPGVRFFEVRARKGRLRDVRRAAPINFSSSTGRSNSQLTCSIGVTCSSSSVLQRPSVPCMLHAKFLYNAIEKLEPTSAHPAFRMHTPPTPAGTLHGRVCRWTCRLPLTPRRPWWRNSSLWRTR